MILPEADWANWAQRYGGSVDAVTRTAFESAETMGRVSTSSAA